MSVTVVPVVPALPGVVLELTDFESVDGGLGGWESLPRPRRSAAAGWVGLPAKTAAIPLILDGMEAGGVGVDISVEPQIATITSWGLPNRTTKTPPVLSVRGLPTISSAERWVLQDVTWGEYTKNRAGARVQQLLTLNLLGYVPPALVKGPAARHRKHKGKG